MPSLPEIKSRLLQKILELRLAIPDPKADLLFDENGVPESTTFFSQKEIETLVYAAQSELDVINFLKKYIFHINYPGGLITSTFLDSLIDTHTMAVNGIFTRSTEVEHPLHSKNNICIGNASVNVFSKKLPSFEILLFDNSKMNFLSSSRFDRVSVVCRNQSSIEFNGKYEQASFRLCDFSHAQLHIGIFQFFTEVSVGNQATAKIVTAHMTHSWIKVHQDAKCEIEMYGDCFVRVNYEERKNLSFSFKKNTLNDLVFYKTGPVLLDEVEKKIFSAKHLTSISENQ